MLDATWKRVGPSQAHRAEPLRIADLAARLVDVREPRSRLRSSYRNFFPPGARWQAAGIRLAR